LKTTASNPLFNVLMFSTFWALQIFVVKLAFNAGARVLPFQVMLLVAATATLLLLLSARIGTDLVQLFRQQPALFWKLFAANAIQSGLGTFLSIIGIAMTGAINAGFLVKLSTVTTTLFAWIILKEKMSALKVAIIAIMISGAYLLTTKGQTLIPAVGDLFILAACFSWSLGNVMVRKILKSEAVQADVVTLQKPFATTPVFLGLIGLALLAPEGLRNLIPVLSCCSFSTQSLPYALGSGVALAMAWIYLYRTLRIATASYMTLMSMLTPILVSILAILFLGEKLVWIQVLGAGMILSAGVLIYFSDIAQT